MDTSRILSVAKEIIRNAAEIGVEEAGTRICGSAWAPLKKVLTPAFKELESRFPALFLAPGPEAKKAASAAVDALGSDASLQKLLTDEFAKLGAGQDEILRVLAAQDETLRGIGAAVDKGFSQQGGQMAAILAEIQELKLQLKVGQVHAGPADNLSIDEIYVQANAYQADAMKWISARDAKIASQRLSQGRELASAGLSRDPTSVKMLVTMGYIEKSQAQVAQESGTEDPVTLLSEAAKYFAKALEGDPNDVNAMNGMANVYLYAKDYDRAIKLGQMVVKQEPSYGAAAFDLSLALEGKIQEVGPKPELITPLRAVYKLLEVLMPAQPQMFPATYLAYVQKRLAALEQLPKAQAAN